MCEECSDVFDSFFLRKNDKLAPPKARLTADK